MWYVYVCIYIHIHTHMIPHAFSIHALYIYIIIYIERGSDDTDMCVNEIDTSTACHAGDDRPLPRGP